MDEKSDVIIVGAGLAGCAAAYLLAQAGLEVIVVERGSFAGSKNVSGGVFYSWVMEELMPGFSREAPIERAITRNTTIFMDECEHLSIDFGNPDFAAGPNSFSVLRARFDSWLADKAEEAGAMIACGVKVDSLIKEGGRVTGIVAGEDEMYADVVIAADGACSFIAEEAGMHEPLNPVNLGVGVKELIGLSKELIEERFNLEEGEGAAYGILGAATQGLNGGGFLYTNRESVSVGLVVHLDELMQSNMTPSDMMENYLAHPAIAPLVKGGELLEYGAHLVLEGGKSAMTPLVSEGLLIVGDAIGLGINSGFVIRGMDLAIESGMLAAKTIIEAKASGDCSLAALKAYETKMESSVSLKDMGVYAKAPHFMKNSDLYTAVPKLANQVLHDIYDHNGMQKQHLLKMAKNSLDSNGLSLRSLFKLIREGVSSL